MALAEVEFHTGVDDRIGFACRLLRKACRQGVRVLVTAPPGLLAELDRALWTFDANEFVPHVRLPGSAPVLARSPIWLAASDDAAAGAADAAPAVLLNLGAEAPRDPTGLQRLIEVVAADPDDAERGRSRWRAYKAAGLAIKHHAGGQGRD